MDKKNIIEELLNDNSEEYSREDLQFILDGELKKTYSDRDYDLINEVTQSLIIMDEKQINIDINSNIENIIKRHREKKRNIPKALRISIAACLIFTILFSVNMVSISAFNINLFSEIVQFGDNLIKFDFSRGKDNIIELKTSKEDPYGLKMETERLGINSMLPTYIPEGFELKNLETDDIENNSYNDLLLHYKQDKYILNIDITEYKERISQNIGFPSANGNLEQRNINGVDVFILSEDGWYRSIFSKGLVVYNVSTNLDYETLIKVLESFE